MARGREPDPRDSSTWRRYVDKVGGEWFEISPGFVALGDRESLESLIEVHLDLLVMEEDPDLDVFEISPGFVALGDRESLESLVRFRLGMDEDPDLSSGPLADVQAMYDLRPA